MKISMLPFSKKLFLLLLLVLFASWLVRPQESFANTHEIWEQTGEQKDAEEIACRKQEEDTGEPCIMATRVNKQQLGDTMKNMSDMLIGCTTPELCDGQPNAVGFLAQAIGTVYAHPPASGVAWTMHTLANAGLVDKAYAQGIGFAGLIPFLPLWVATRNIAYMILIIIMVAIGFMVIFQMKIDPKTVISVQAALPKIVMTLIIITLSYPIVGFLIDIMYLSMAILISIVVKGLGGRIGTSGDAAMLQTYYMTADIGDLFKSVFYAGTATLDDFAKGFAPLLGGSIGLGAILGIFVTAVFTPILAILVAAAPLLLFLLILGLGLLFTFIRLLLLLLNSYIQLVISVILGPILLLQEAIPGRSAFTGWIMNIMANLVVFPATVVIFMFAMFLTTSDTSGPSWMPPFIGIQPRNFFNALLGLGVIFLSPTLVAQIKKAFHPKPVLPISAGTAFAPLTGGIQTSMGAASQFYYMQQIGHMIPGLKNILPGAQKQG